MAMEYFVAAFFALALVAFIYWRSLDHSEPNDGTTPIEPPLTRAELDAYWAEMQAAQAAAKKPTAKK